MQNKFDLRTKTFILYLVFIILLSVGGKYYLTLPSSLHFLVYFAYILYLIPLVLLIYNTNKSRKIAWITSFIFALVLLFYQIFSIIKINPVNVSALILNLTGIPISILIIIYAISELKKQESKSFDKWISYIFIFAYLILPFLISFFYEELAVFGLKDIGALIRDEPLYFGLRLVKRLIFGSIIPALYLISLFVWNKIDKNEIKNKFDLRTKIFILYSIFFMFSYMGLVIYLEAWKVYYPYIISSIIYFCSLILLTLYNTEEKRKIAWKIAIIPSLTMLFNPLKSPLNPGTYQGTILYLFQLIKFGDITTALLMLIGSVIPILIIIFAVTEIINYKKNNLDKNIGIFFIVFYFISPILTNLTKLLTRTSFSPKINFLGIFISPIIAITPVLFVASLLFWNYLEKKKEK